MPSRTARNHARANPFQQQNQFIAPDFRRPIRTRRETSTCQTFGPQRQTVAIPVKCFHEVAAAIHEHEQIPGQWILFEFAAHNS